MENSLNWFTGGENYTYKTLIHCLDHDYVTLTLVLSLCVGVFSGYCYIAYRWSLAESKAPDSAAKRALGDLKWIFILCGVCGYLWVMIDAFWPGWRFYMLVMAVLNFFTWRYVFRVEALDGIYSYLKDRQELVHELELREAEIERLKRSKIYAAA